MVIDVVIVGVACCSGSGQRDRARPVPRLPCSEVAQQGRLGILRVHGSCWCMLWPSVNGCMCLCYAEPLPMLLLLHNGLLMLLPLLILLLLLLQIVCFYVSCMLSSNQHVYPATQNRTQILPPCPHVILCLAYVLCPCSSLCS